MRFALIQLSVGSNKSVNVKNAVNAINAAKKNGINIAILPECFNSPYGTKYFPTNAELIPTGETCKQLSNCAKENNIYIVGGSIPEVDGSKLYNTCTVWNPQGELIAKHRKIHLFDIDVPGKITFKESDSLSPGNSFTVFSIGTLKIGIGICYDVRFPELAAIYRNEGCDMIIYPGAFNMTTGPLHWQALMRARAIDNQIYVAAVSPAQDKGADYVAWGHSMLVDPYGKVVDEAEFEEKVIYVEIDLEKVSSVRQNIPVQSQKRHDLYKLTYNKL